MESPPNQQRTWIDEVPSLRQWPGSIVSGYLGILRILFLRPKVAAWELLYRRREGSLPPWVAQSISFLLLYGVFEFGAKHPKSPAWYVVPFLRDYLSANFLSWKNLFTATPLLVAPMVGAWALSHLAPRRDRQRYSDLLGFIFAAQFAVFCFVMLALCVLAGIAWRNEIVWLQSAFQSIVAWSAFLASVTVAYVAVQAALGMVEMEDGRALDALRLKPIAAFFASCGITIATLLLALWLPSLYFSGAEGPGMKHAPTTRSVMASTARASATNAAGTRPATP